MNEFEQNLLLGATFVVLAGTLTVFVWQWLRGRGDRED